MHPAAECALADIRDARTHEDADEAAALLGAAERALVRAFGPAKASLWLEALLQI